jgi:hypothetical protein
VTGRQPNSHLGSLAGRTNTGRAGMIPLARRVRGTQSGHAEYLH